MTRRGAFWRRAISLAASGSVGETIAPSANATAHGIAGTSAWMATATTTVVASTSPTASSEIARRSARRSRRFAKNAAEYSSGGSRIASTSSGGSSMCGMPGIRPITTPPTRSGIG